MLARYPDKSGHKHTHTHTQQMHWLWKLCFLLQPHRRYGPKRQWLFTWKIDDASALTLTFLSWVRSRSIFFFAAFTFLFTRNAQWFFFRPSIGEKLGFLAMESDLLFMMAFIDVFHALFSAMHNTRAFGVRWLFQEQPCCYFSVFSRSFRGRLQGKLNASG